MWFKHPSATDYVLSSVSLSISEGELVAVIGANGAGKTTLVRHVNGLLKPTKGDVIVFGQDTRKASVAQLSRKVGIVFQNPDHQLFSETVRKEVEFGLQNFGFDDKRREERVEQVLQTFDLKKYENASPMMLSGGEKKRLCFATVMAWDPQVLIMDEPTVGQDFPNKTKISEVIRSLTSQGKSVILVSHDVEFLWPLQPRTLMLSKGRVIFDGKAEDAFTNEDLLAESSVTAPQLVQVARLLGESPTNFLDLVAASSFLSSYRNGKGGY